MRSLIFALIIFCVVGCGQNKTVDNDNENAIQSKVENSDTTGMSETSTGTPKPLIPDTSVRMNIFKNTEISGYGYDILIGEKLYIHQPNIPAVEGNNGFTSEEKARIAAAFIIHKIKRNIMPPSVTAGELDSLGVR